MLLLHNGAACRRKKEQSQRPVRVITLPFPTWPGQSAITPLLFLGPMAGRHPVAEVTKRTDAKAPKAAPAIAGVVLEGAVPILLWAVAFLSHSWGRFAEDLQKFSAVCQSLAGSAASACFIGVFVLCERTQTFPRDPLRVWGRTERVPLWAGLRSLPWPQMHSTQRLSWHRYLGAGSVCGIWPCLLSEKQVAPLKGSRAQGSLASSHSPVAAFPFCLLRPELLFLQTAILHPPSCGSWKISLCPLVFFFSFSCFLQLPIFFFLVSVEQNKRLY